MDVSLEKSQNIIKENVAQHKVVVFCDSKAQETWDTHRILKTLNQKYTAVPLDRIAPPNKSFKEGGRSFHDGTSAIIEDQLAKCTDQRLYLPKIFICGRFLGGLKMLQYAFKQPDAGGKSRLESLLAECKQDDRYR